MGENISILKWSYTDLESYFRELIKASIQLEKAPIPSLWEISGISRYENAVSDWYAFFLDENGLHGLKRLFIDSLHSLLDSDMTFDSYTITREHPTKSGKSLDILIASVDEDENYLEAILIENKIDHVINNPFRDYWEDINTPLEEDKVGVILTLKKIPDENFPVGKGNWINLTHGQWLDKIKSNLGHHLNSADSKCLIYLQDFIHNLDKMTQKIELTDSVKFFWENGKKIHELFQLREISNRFITDTIISALPETNWEYNRLNAKSVAIYFKEMPCVYVYVGFGNLFVPDNHQFSLDLWIKGGQKVEVLKSNWDSVVKIIANFGNVELREGESQGKEWI